MKPYRELTPRHLHTCVARLPKDVRKAAAEYAKIGLPLFIAGGYIRARLTGQAPSDIDILGPSKEVVEAAAKTVHGGREGSRLHRTQNALTILCPPRTPVQFIHRWTYDDPAKLLGEFDFTIAQAVIWCEIAAPPQGRAASTKHLKWRSLCAAAYYEDLAVSELVYTKPERAEDVGGSLLRAFKFTKRGFYASPETIGRLVSRLMTGILDREGRPIEMNLAPSKSMEQFVTAKLREVDPLYVIDGVDLLPECYEGGHEDEPPPQER